MMASFSGSKSETVGCGLARSSDPRDDPDELRVLFISFDISRISCARWLEVVDPVMFVVYFWCDWALFQRSRVSLSSRDGGALLVDRINALTGQALSLLELYCGEWNISYDV